MFSLLKNARVKGKKIEGSIFFDRDLIQRMKPCFYFFVWQLVPLCLMYAMYFRITKRWYPAGPEFLISIFWILGSTGLLILLLMVFYKSKCITYIVYAVIALLSIFISLISVSNAIHISLFKSHISFLSIEPVLQTDLQEINNFYNSYIGFYEITISCSLLLCFVSLLVLYIKHKELNFGKYLVHSLFIFVFAFVSLCIVSTKKYFEDNTYSFFRKFYVTRFIIEYNKALKNQDTIISYIKKAKENVDFGKITNTDDSLSKTFVLIMNEGASRDHMSLYGYDRETSRYIDDIKDSLFVYDRVISTYGSTASSLKDSLIFHEIQEDTGIASIITLMRQAGFKTYWITNNLAEVSGQGAAWMNASSDVLIRKNVSVSFTSPTPYDEGIVPEFKKVLKDKAPWKFIVLHLAGMHPTYKFRYPSQFDIYNDTLKNSNGLSMNEVSKINHYDNAMTYNSYFIRTILNELEKENTVSYLLVTSDHAQELGQSDESIVEHKPTGGSQFQYNIPFFLWLSPEYKNRNCEFTSYINTTLHRFWRTDALQYSIADLSRIEFDKNKKSKSIFSNQYIYPGTMINGGTTDYAKLFGGADCSQ